ncbi:MAG: Dabb family protein [Dehalococcoidia bacterium]|nr:Dabb family protein [Dehalococcoidia bacterium]
MPIRHVVFVKFLANADPAAIERFIAEVDRLPSLNTEVRNWVSGRSPEPRFHNGDFDWGLSCDLDDWDAMDRYMWHEAHLRTSPFVPDAVDYLLSFDFEHQFAGLASQQERTASPEPVAAPPDAAPRVPSLRGRRPTEARQILARCGLTMDEDVRPIPGSVWAPGRVVAVEPAVGTPLPRGTSVRVTVTGDWWMRPDLGRP